MTQRGKLTDRQAKALFIVTDMLQAAGGELPSHTLETAGVGIKELQGLRGKGALSVRFAPFVMPAGPLAGETMEHPYYSC